MSLLNNNFNLCFLGLYPEIYLLISVLFIICFLVIIDKYFNYKFNLIYHSGYLYIFTLIYTLWLNIFLNVTNLSIFYNILLVNKFVIFIKSLVIISLIIITLVGINYLKFEKVHSYEFFILLNIITLGLFTIISANDLLVMYLGIEIMSLSFYILTTLKIYNNFSTEAGLKYFILGSFSSGFMLYGSSLIYGSTGSINFSDLNLIFNSTLNISSEFNSVIIGLIFIIVSILFKLGAAPFHMWLPDVYEGAPTIVTMLFSIIPKVAILVLFLHLNLNFYYLNNYFLQELLMYIAALSIMVGTFGGLYQSKIKRLFAYSAISHVGFLLIGFLSFQNASIFAVFFYIIIYIIISINIFTMILLLRKYTNQLKLKKINELVILFKSHPLLAINFALILFSIAGIPPLVGFYSKLYVFTFALESKLYLIVLIAAIFSVIASLYYIRLIKLMFFKTFEYWNLFQGVTKIESYILSITLFFNIFFFCYPEIIVMNLYNIILQVFY